MNDEIRRPKVVYEPGPDRQPPLGPVGAAVQDHAGLGPQQLVVQTEADLLEEKWGL